jgi:hypothetical protein
MVSSLFLSFVAVFINFVTFNDCVSQVGLRNETRQMARSFKYSRLLLNGQRPSAFVPQADLQVSLTALQITSDVDFQKPPDIPAMSGYFSG